MHEMGLALEIIDIAIASVPPNLKDAKIKKINVQIGKLSAVTPENLKFCFDVASKQTLMDGVELCVEVVPIVIKCRKCKTEFTINEPFFRCGKCNSRFVDVLSGKELDIRSIEVKSEE